MTTYYRCADPPPGVPSKDWGQYRVKPTGEFRCPKEGEWYLSGAIIEGYYASNDLIIEHNIGKLVKIRKILTYEEVE